MTKCWKILPWISSTPKSFILARLHQEISKKYQDREADRILKASAGTLADKNADSPMFGGLDDDDIRKNYPSFRFSGEVMACIRIIYETLNNVDCHDHTNKESFISR